MAPNATFGTSSPSINVSPPRCKFISTQRENVDSLNKKKKEDQPLRRHSTSPKRCRQRQRRQRFSQRSATWPFNSIDAGGEYSTASPLAREVVTERMVQRAIQKIRSSEGLVEQFRSYGQQYVIVSRKIKRLEDRLAVLDDAKRLLHLTTSMIERCRSTLKTVDMEILQLEFELNEQLKRNPIDVEAQMLEQWCRLEDLNRLEYLKRMKVDHESEMRTLVARLREVDSMISYIQLQRKEHNRLCLQLEKVVSEAAQNIVIFDHLAENLSDVRLVLALIANAA